MKKIVLSLLETLAVVTVAAAGYCLIELLPITGQIWATFGLAALLVTFLFWSFYISMPSQKQDEPCAGCGLRRYWPRPIQCRYCPYDERRRNAEAARKRVFRHV